jgi:hypothetical protein
VCPDRLTERVAPAHCHFESASQSEADTETLASMLAGTDLGVRWSNASIPPSERWYVVTKGLDVGVFQGW